MNEHGGDWPAYTVGYGETFEDDELADAAETAALLGARHIPVRLDRQEFERSLPKIVGCLEEPIASSSIVPMYFVCQRAREDVKVALIGQGPDELFCGYKRHLGVRYGESWRSLPSGDPPADSGQRSTGCRATRRSSAASTRSASRTGCSATSTCFPSRRPRRSTVSSGTVCCREATRAPSTTGAALLPQMEHLDELGGLPAPRDPVVAAGRTADVRRQAVDGARPRGPRSVPRSDGRGVRAAPGREPEDPQAARASGCIARSAASSCRRRFSRERSAGSP